MIVAGAARRRIVVRFCVALPVAAIVLAACAPGGARTAPPALVSREPLTAILGAMPVEIALLKTQLGGLDSTVVAGMAFYHGRLSDRRVVLARVGVGKVNAAMVTALLLDRFAPTEVIFTGIAGAISTQLDVGDVVLAIETVQHDLGTLTSSGIVRWGARPASDTTPNPVRFPGDTLLLRVAAAVARDMRLTAVPRGTAERSPRITTGVVVTGDVFVKSAEKKRELMELGADAVEMEGAAVAQVCWQWRRTPLLVIRSISDRADDDAVSTYVQFRDVAAGNSAALVRAIVGALPTVPR